MPAVLLNTGRDLMATNFTQTMAVPIDSVRIGSLAPAQRYDATAAPGGTRTLGLLDATPRILPTANITLLSNMGNVQIDISDEDLTQVYDADEIAFMSGTTPVFLVAQASGPYFRKVANASALFSLNFLIAGNTASNITISVPTFVFATQAQAEAGTAANVMMSPLRTRQSVLVNAPSVDYQAFTASGTWTKPAGVKTDSVVRVQMWGGGAGGTQGGGGGGAAYAEFLFPASELGATEPVVVGQGGAGNTSRGINNGVAGRDSTFHGLFARGGGRALDRAEQGGYGSSNRGGGSTNGELLTFSGGRSSVDAYVRNSLYGGGAGGFDTPVGRREGGVSVLAGNGGDYGTLDGSNGIAPGGGGGRGRSGTGGNGARGEVRVTVFY